MKKLLSIEANYQISQINQGNSYYSLLVGDSEVVRVDFNSAENVDSFVNYSGNKKELFPYVDGSFEIEGLTFEGGNDNTLFLSKKVKVGWLKNIEVNYQLNLNKGSKFILN